MTARSTFGERIRAAKPRDEYYDLWDETVSSLGLRIGPSGQRTFFLRRKLPTGKVRSVTLGSADRMSVAEARRVLATLLDEPEQRVVRRHPGQPMAEFAEEFLERYVRDWFASMADRRGAANRSVTIRMPNCGATAPTTAIPARTPGATRRSRWSGS